MNTIHTRLVHRSAKPGPSPITGFVDASFRSCRDTGRSRSGWFWAMAGGAACWGSKLEDGKPALSTAEAELAAAVSCLKDGLFIKNLLREIGHMDFDMPLVVNEDNQATIKTVKTGWTSKRTRSLDVKYFWVRFLHDKGLVKFQYVGTKDQHADALTKALHATQAGPHYAAMGLMTAARGRHGSHPARE